MPDAGLGRAVLELAVDDCAYNEAVDAAERKAKALETRFEKVGKSLESVGKSFESTGKSLTIGVTAPILAVTAGLGVLVSSTASAGDAIAKTAQEAGLSAETFQELTFALGQIAQVEESQLRLALGTLNQRLGEAAQGSKTASEAFAALGLSARDLRNGTVTSEQALDALIRRLQQTKSAGEAAALASAVLGERVGRVLGPAIRASGGDVAALRQQFRDLGLGMSGEAVAAAEQFQDTMDIVHRQLRALGWEIGAELLPVLLDDLIPAFQAHVIPAIRSLAEITARAIRAFGDLPAPAQTAALTLATVFAASGPALVALGLLTTALGKATKAMRLLRLNALALNPAIALALVTAGALTRSALMTDLEKLEQRAASLQKRVEGGFATKESIADLEATRAAIAALRAELAATEDAAEGITTVGAAAGAAAPQFGALDEVTVRFTGSLRRLREGGFEAWAEEVRQAGLAAEVAAVQVAAVLDEFARAPADMDPELFLHRGLSAEFVATAEAQAAAAEAARAGFEATAQAAIDLERDIVEGQRVLDGFTADLEAATERAREMGAAGREVGGALGHGLERAVLAGEPLRDVLQGLAQDLLQIIFRLTVIKSLEAALGGLFAGFGGGGSELGPAGAGADAAFGAEGGHFGAGEPVFVGEKGIELFVPDRSGTIIPHDALGARGQTIVNIDARGAQRGVGPEIRRALLEVEERAVRRSVGQVVDERLRGGRFRSAFG